MSEFTFDLPHEEPVRTDNMLLSKTQAIVIFSQATGITLCQSKALIEQNWLNVYARMHTSTYVRPLALGRMIRAYYLTEKGK